MKTRKEVLRAHLEEYLKASRKEKGDILNRLAQTLQMKRKAVTQGFSRMLKHDPWKSSPKKRGRKTIYGPEIISALRTVWETSGEICVELLHPVVSEYVSVLKRDKLWKHSESATSLLLKMSEGTMKVKVRGFLKARRKGKGNSATKPSKLKEIIPIFTGPWEGKPPGYGQMDTVVHCGASLSGDMVFTLQYVDTATYWSIRGAQWNKGERATLENLDAIREHLPFPMIGAHSDSGGEFVNWTMKRFCEKEGIDFTRSRPYHKNDNAFVEERNGHVVRKHIGYVRLDVPEVVPVLNEFYEVLNLYQNHFIPSRRCVSKERVGSKYVRKYEKAATPYARVMTYESVPKNLKEKLQKEHESLNPLKLKRELDILRKTVFEIQKTGAGNRKTLSAFGDS
jgi:hypothetical protein